MSSENSKRRIVITGVGLVSPIGIGITSFAENLHAGRSGISSTESYPNTATPHGIGGEVKDFTEKSLRKEYFKEKEQKKSIKLMCRDIQMGATAALLALEDSGLEQDSIDRSRIGVEYGANLMLFSPESVATPSGACRGESGKFEMSKWGPEGITRMEPLWMLRYLPNMPACHIGIFTDSHGPNNSVTVDEASAGVAMNEALNILERGSADVMIVGGTGSHLDPMKSIHARLWETLAYDEEHPEASCKPFDIHRCGQVVGEGSGCFILEEEEHARARGARIYGRVLGAGSSCVATPQGPVINQAVSNAMQAALKRADVAISDVGHINAHGLGTIEEDAAEAQGIVLTGGAGVPVTSSKGYFGNTGAGTGFLEMAASLLALEQGQIPQTLNCQTPDSGLGIDVVTTPRSTNNHLFMNINFARTGQASATIIEHLPA